MPRVEFEEDRDPTYERMPFQAITVFPRFCDGTVMLMVETGDGWHSILADAPRWEAIIAAVRASLEEKTGA